MLGMVNSLKHIPTNTLSLVPLPHTPHISHPHLTPFSFLISQVCTSRRKQQASIRYDSHLTHTHMRPHPLLTPQSPSYQHHITSLSSLSQVCPCRSETPSIRPLRLPSHHLPRPSREYFIKRPSPGPACGLSSYSVCGHACDHAGGTITFIIAHQ